MPVWGFWNRHKDFNFVLSCQLNWFFCKYTWLILDLISAIIFKLVGKGATKESGFIKPAIHLRNKLHVATCVYSLHYNIILFFFSYLHNSSVWVAKSKSSAPHLTCLFQILYLTSFMKLFSHTTHLLVLTHRKDNRAAGEGESTESKRAAATLLKFLANYIVSVLHYCEAPERSQRKPSKQDSVDSAKTVDI